MSRPIIIVENLGKKYQLKHQAERQRYVALRDVITDRVKGLFKRSKKETGGQKSVEDFWALKDVSFQVKQGEVVGIIGRNGAGKSTLLKILSRITEPTQGRVTLRGRVASLLEVGTGFHPELTGRENVFLNGSILGMSRGEIRKKFDEIVAFAEVEKFLDTPVKRYSSGMYVRLAFAVAAHLEPEILIVDEVLAVGDTEFQKKCLGKMQNVATQQGRTVLFVSHNMAAVRSLCSRGIYLKSGSLQIDGQINKTVDTYLGQGADAEGEVAWDNPATAPKDDAMMLLAVRTRSEGRIASSVWIDQAVEIEIDYETLEADLLATVSIHVNVMGTCAFVGGPLSSVHRCGRHRSVCTIPAKLLNDGTYQVTVFLITNTTNLRVIKRDAISFNVYEKGREEYLGHMIGAVRPDLKWSSHALESQKSATIAALPGCNANRPEEICK